MSNRLPISSLFIVAYGVAFTLSAGKVQTQPTGDKGTPKIEFETNLFDFGTITTVETLTGRFKFKNAGDGVLKIGAPGASCDCTEAKVKPDALAPGESGELTYTIKLE